MPNYRVTTRADDPNNTMMEATQQIRPGEKILSEGHLADLTVSLASTFDESQWLNPRSPHCGRADLIRMRNALPQDRRNKFNSLYNMGPDNDIVTLVATNCFTESEKQASGYNMMVLRIYELISRVNHSCQPNAIVSWHRQVQKAYLRALKRIDPGTEITISYFPAEEDSFRSREKRQRDLNQNYRFMCACEVCALNNVRSRIDDNIRADALEIFNQLGEEELDINDPEDANKAANEDIKLIERYIARLDKLGVIDHKLAFGYQKLAEFQHCMFPIAQTAARTTGKPHCPACKARKGPQSHLDSAWEAIGKAHAINIRIHGQGHPRTASVEKVMKKISKDRSRI